MRILVTGSAGHIGREQVRVLREAGHEIRTLDRVAQKKSEVGEHFVGDLRDLDTVRRAVAGMDAIVHLGAIPNDRRGAEEQILSINVQGTWNILLACVEAEVGRVVNFSSINALGCVGERRTIDAFPITDALPHYPMSPYQISKHIGEELCALFAARHGIVTISLRPALSPRRKITNGSAAPTRSEAIRRARRNSGATWIGGTFAKRRGWPCRLKTCQTTLSCCSRRTRTQKRPPRSFLRPTTRTRLSYRINPSTSLKIPTVRYLTAPTRKPFSAGNRVIPGAIRNRAPEQRAGSGQKQDKAGSFTVSFSPRKIQLQNHKICCILTQEPCAAKLFLRAGTTREISSVTMT